MQSTASPKPRSPILRRRGTSPLAPAVAIAVTRPVHHRRRRRRRRRQVYLPLANLLQENICISVSNVEVLLLCPSLSAALRRRRAARAAAARSDDQNPAGDAGEGPGPAWACGNAVATVSAAARLSFCFKRLANGWSNALGLWPSAGQVTGKSRRVSGVTGKHPSRDPSTG